MSKLNAADLIGRELFVSKQNADGTYTVAEAIMCDCGKLAYSGSHNVGFKSQAGFEAWFRQTRPVIVKALPPMVYATESGAECDSCAKPVAAA